MVNFLPRLPPGLYKIPLDYIATYDDNGRTGNVPGERLSGYHNEMGYYQHRDILNSIEFPPSNENRMPYLLIQILEDPGGPDISGYVDSGQNQYPGTVMLT